MVFSNGRKSPAASDYFDASVEVNVGSGAAGFDSTLSKHMTDEFRTPHDSSYVAAIGRAIFIFANYEWTVVHTMERLRPGFLSKWRFAKNPMTAGRLGKKFEKAVNESNDLALPLTSTLKEAARAFVELADERNELVHAHVYSEPGGRQQLIYQGKDKSRTWSIAEIDDLAHRFENSSIALRDFMKEIWNI
jgi:hypothetical protein